MWDLIISVLDHCLSFYFTLKKQSALKDVRKYFFTLKIVNPWNNLPENVINPETLNQFKNRFDKYIGATMYSYEPENLIQMRGGNISLSFQP